MSKKRGYGERIRDARKAAGYSQKGLLERLGWPSDSNARLSGYENEDREPVLADFDAIAKLVHVDVAWMVFGDYRISEEDSALIQGFKNATPEVKTIVRAALRITSRNNQKKSDD